MPDGQEESYGFYPQKKTISAIYHGTPGIVKNPDAEHNATDFKMLPVTMKGLEAARAYASLHSNSLYSLYKYNCADFARGMYRTATGKPAPFAGFLIADPKDLAESIQREL